MATEVKKIPVFDVAFTRAIADVIAQTEYPGLSNRELDLMLQQVKITERAPGNKRDSLYYTLHNTQVKQQCGNAMAAFVAKAMHPSRYARDPTRFMKLRDEINESIVYFGWTLTETGNLGRGATASTLTEGAALAGQLLTELTRRGVHAQIVTYCAEEFVTNSLFHAMTEASKSVPSRIRSITGLAGDGAALYDAVMGTGGAAVPKLFINPYRTDSEVSEHKGFKNLLLGIHGHYRNPRAHSSRVDASESIQDFYDAFGLFSYVHRRIDLARFVP